MRKRLLAVLLTAAMAVTTLVGCGSSEKNTESAASAANGEANSSVSEEAAPAEDNAEVVELEFWGWWSSETRKPHMLTMVDNFNKSQSKYHVTYVDIPWGDIFTKNIAQIAAGNPCDIIANDLSGVQFRAAEGQVESVSPYLTDDVKGGFYDQYIEACSDENGEVYALPYNVDTRGIFYNKAHFEEAGINPEDIKTWSDLVDAARKLDVKNGDTWDRIGFLPVIGNGGVDTWVFNMNKGRGWYDPETLEATVNTDANKETFKWIRDQIDSYGQSTYNEINAAVANGMTDPFASGKVSMWVHTSAYPAALANTAPDLEYGVISLPEFKEGNGHMVNGDGFVLEIPKGAKCPEGSYEFIKYITGKENQEYMQQNLKDFSARNDLDPNSEFLSNPVTKALAKCLEETATNVTVKEIQGYTSVVNPLIEEGTLGLTPTDKALDNAQKALEDFIANNSGK